MSDTSRPKQPNGRSTIYKGSDGSWHGRVTVGLRPDGRADRRHVRGLTKAAVTDKVRALETQRAQQKVPTVGARWTVESWLTHWLENIVSGHVKPNTLAGYRVAVNYHLIPGLGQHKLDALQPEHLESFYRTMRSQRTKLGPETSPATVHQAHRTIRAALNEAMRRGHITRNPAQFARAPRVEPLDVEPFTVEEIRKIFIAASHHRNGTRWALALALGLRQGEALGLRWEDIDFGRGVLSVRRSRTRPRYAHGCGGTCDKKYAGYCPERVQTNEDSDTTKSRAGRRLIGLPPQLVALLEGHRDAQLVEQARAANLWEDGGWVFTNEIGEPINPRSDWSHWKALLAEAGIRDSRLHDARHTAATVLLLLGVSQPAIMSIMGWSNPAMTQRYAHVIAPIRREVATRVGNLLWEPAALANIPDDGPEGGLPPARALAQ